MDAKAKQDLQREARVVHATGRPGKIEIHATKPLTTQRDLSLLYSPGVAAPCLEFTSFLLGRADVGTEEEIGDDRAFLHEGTRGYILGVRHLAAEHLVRVGDEVVVEA